jgi:hypothetical protein
MKTGELEKAAKEKKEKNNEKKSRFDKARLQMPCLSPQALEVLLRGDWWYV